MKRLTFILLLSIALMESAYSDAEEARPNIVVLYADDIGYGDFSSYGATGVSTPNVDRLARTGVRFLSGYCSAATCTPSRYSLLTGSYAFRNQSAKILKGNAPLIIDPEQPTLPRMLKDEGYRTGLVGKWHLGLGEANDPLDWNGDIAPGPREVGFDYSFHIAATGDRVPSVYIEDGRIVDLDPSDPVSVSYADPVGSEPTGISDPERLRMQADRQHSGTIVNGISRIGTMTGGESARFVDEDMADVFLEKAVEFLDSSEEKPFFLYYALHQNHVPRLPHPRFKGASSMGVRGDTIAEFDWSVGEFMDALKSRGLAENTLVILSSDNGPVLFDGYWDGAVELNGGHKPGGPYRGTKYSLWEAGTRVPFIVSWPKRIDPGVSDALISQVDLLATIAGILGIDADFPSDSKDLSEALVGEDPHGRDYIIEEALGDLAVRTRLWKYIPSGVVTERLESLRFHRTEVPESGYLFNLAEDPGEKKNLAHSYPEVVEDMKKILKSVGQIPSSSTKRDQMGFKDDI